MAVLQQKLSYVVDDVWRDCSQRVHAVQRLVRSVQRCAKSCAVGIPSVLPAASRAPLTVLSGFVVTSMNTQLPALNVLIVRHEDRVVRRVVDRRPVDRGRRAPRDVANRRERLGQNSRI